MRTNRKFLGLAGAALLAGWGCGDGSGGAPPASASNAAATVKGTVTLDGKPLPGGEITFDPTNINRKAAGARTARIGPDGSYSVGTLAGSNSVTVRGPKISADPRLATNGKQVEVQEGDSVVPIELP